MSNINSSNAAVLVLDPRGLIATGGLEVIKRHIEYGRSLHKLNPHLKLIILTSVSNTKKRIVNNKYVEIYDIKYPTHNFIEFSLAAKKMIDQNEFKIELMIAGDAWESFWSAFLLNYFIGRKIPIQIQLHADIADPRWRKINLTNKFRYKAGKLSLRLATSIRCVSTRQKINLVNNLKIKESKIFVIPIPIKIFKEAKIRSQNLRTIGFIGRIHKDRGIWQFIELVKELGKQNLTFGVIIAGDGPDRAKFLSRLENVIPKMRIKYLGQINQKSLQEIWKYIGVLVSMAPVESYGRVLRESLSSGVPVWATPSSGVLDLLDIAERGTVKLLDINNDTAKLSVEFESLLRGKVGTKFRDRFIKENNSYAGKLAKSWIGTIESYKK